MPEIKVPRGLGADVRVIERGGDHRIGTIISAAGNKMWNVRFDSCTDLEIRSSSQLKLHKAAYGKPTQSLAGNVMASVKKYAPRTGRKPANYNESPSNSILPSSSSSSSIHNRSFDESYASQESQQSRRVSTNPNESFTSQESQRSRRVSIGGLSFHLPVSSPRLSSASESLKTPKTIRFSPSPSGIRVRNLFGGTSAHESGRSCYNIPEENENFDDFEVEEEDEFLGDTGENFEDKYGYSREEYQKNSLKAKLARENMEKEKDKLIRDHKTFKVEVKGTNEYDIGGRVQGRTNSQFKNDTGTIIDVLDSDRFLVEWDDGNTTEAKKSVLKLLGVKEVYTWEVVEDHIAENPPSAYEHIGAVGFSTSTMINLDRESADYAYPYKSMLQVRVSFKFHSSFLSLSLTTTYVQIL